MDNTDLCFSASLTHSRLLWITGVLQAWEHDDNSKDTCISYHTSMFSMTL